MSVGPATDHTATGPYGGPFTASPASYTVQNTGGGFLNWSVTGPSWLTLSPASGGPLAASASQTVTATVNASANTVIPSTQTGIIRFTDLTSGATVTRLATLTITPPDMRADPPSLGPATAGVPYSGSYSCTNITTGVAPNATCNISGLPPGLTGTCSPSSTANLAGNSLFLCSVSGIPTAGGNYSVSVTTSSDFDTNTANTTATTNVTVTAPDMSISLAGLGPGTAGIPYSGSFTCTNGTAAPAPNATCTATGLPTGLSVDACSPVGVLVGNALIVCNVTGTPTVGGTFSVAGSTGSVYDGDTSNNAATTSVVVTAPDMSISLANLPVTATVGVPYSGSFTCTNGTAALAPNATCAVSGLPSGLTVDACSPIAFLVGNSVIVCNVTGTPLAGGTFNLNGSTSSVYDNVNNNDTASRTLTVDKGTTTTTITSDAPDPSVVGQTYTVSVTVAGAAGAGTPTGTVTITDGTLTCTPALSGGSASCPFSSPAIGTPTLTATYAGDSNFTGSSDTEAHTVNKGNTTTAVTAASPEPSAFGQTYTVTVSVSAAAPASGTPTGTVTISDGTNSCTTPALSGGTASCAIAGGAPAGSATLTATYAGDANFNGSSGSAAHGIDIGPTTTVITADAPDPSVFGQPYTVSVQVAAGGSASGVPTGTVTISDGTNNCTTPALSVSGTASCVIAGGTPVGSVTLTATYSGSSNFAPSSGTATHAISQGTTTTAITAQTPNPSVFGAPYTVAVQVSPSGSAAGTPTGTVSISDGTNSCTTPAISASGTAACAIPGGTAPGAVPLTATYSGDASFTASSGTATHTINQGATTTAITADTPDPSVFGQPYTVSVLVQPAGGAVGIPTGPVTISDGTNSCTTPALSASGTATCVIAGGTVPGAVTLTATYAGDVSFSGSAGTTVHTINHGATLTTITADTPDPSIFGQPYTIAVSVVPSGSASGTPSGTVTISDGTNSCTTTALSASGTASCVLSATPVGNATLTATYVGDANFAGSSDTEAHAINQIVTATSLVQSANPTFEGAPVTFTAAVSPTVATGAITFKNGSTTLGVVVVSSGSASFTISSLAAGAHSITAVYSGDTNYTGSNSPALVHTVTPNGTIKLVISTVEGDGTFAFASATPALAQSVTTSGGSGQTSAASLNPGSYAVSVTLPDGFGLTAVSCSDSDSVGSASGKSATIVLAPAENVTCTFTSANSRKKTVEVIGQFMSRRADLLLSNGPDTNRQIDRLLEACEAETNDPSCRNTTASASLTGQTDVGTAGAGFAGPTRLGDAQTGSRMASAFGAFGAQNGVNAPTLMQKLGMGSAGSQPINGMTDALSEDRPGISPVRMSGGLDSGLRMSFGTSLSSMRKYAEDAETRRLESTLTAAGLTGGAVPAPRAMYSPFDIWVEGHYASFGDDRGGNQQDGHFGVVYVGADYVVTPWLLIGALAQYDSMSMTSKTETYDISGHGWMAGPYGTLKLSEHLYLQGRAAWGSSENAISPFRTYRDDFSSSRWLASSTLVGRWQWGAWEFRPTASLAYIEDNSSSYTDSLGVVIPGVKVSLGQFKAGPEIAYKYTLEDGTILQPRLGIEAIWNFDASDNVGNFGGTLTGTEGVRGKIEAGIRGQFSNGLSLEFSAAYDGIGSDSFDSVSARATLRVPLN